jgi:L-fuculose-phosphate aldolase
VNAPDALVELGRRVAAAGLVVGAGGNVSARVGADEILISGTGRRLETLTAADLASVRLDGTTAGPAVGPAPSSELPMHLAAHRARPDLGFVVHAHPAKANVLTATGRTIRLITLDHAYYVRRLVTVPYLPSGSDELAAAVGDALARASVVVLSHHGCLVVAPDADLAFERVANLEAAASATFDALLLGDVGTVCPPEYLERIEARERGQ